MEQTFFLSMVAFFLFGAAVVHGQDVGDIAAIDCSNVQGITINIDLPDIGEWDSANTDDQDLWALNDKTDSSCKPTFNQGAEQVQYAAFSAATCADEPTVSGDKLVYEFVINVPAPVPASGAPVIYAYDHQYAVKCYYNRQQENLMASFEPLNLLSDDGSAVNEFVIAFTLHKADNDAPIVPGDVLDLSTAIYGKVAITDDAGFPVTLDIHFKSVTASSDNAGADEFTLVTNGCPVSVVTSVDCDKDDDDRFLLSSFRFPGQVAGNQVYFKATVIVCLDDAGSECQTECSACSKRRKRRETVQESLRTTYYVSAGPYRIGDANKDAAVDKDEGAAFPAYMIAVLAVCGVVAIAIVSAVVLIVLRRRQNTTTAKPRDAGVTA